ncbi:Maf-like protein [Campylobacter sputorum subsp. bubulus]|uniref:Nucleoside triphosphate pyrophosphatase n=1 Tax=Campylobacter sputorum subsp. sputorum TaxID=32024 RepID=A0A381DIZ6_9BACT|nr:septum formation inhibitor Maf [Campylobacter sputorum]ASM35678.1 septum formation protein Maf [Campylobacter sputorum aubsp. sputorum RM3237]ASM37396.1 septum formation protein Maf [Campylobacter sputorum bv. faecalis CCUG 20703]KAB0582592.1 septum formation inhibitor Maf [Campylobacter sputorum subsp. sputorum]QEL05870.1 septum formation protein Maf [Campylobacter sputorum subsp. sputorum]SUX07901.1 Maf-like protein [Campylobacter sputorum subsp. bubulus]
MLTLASSSQTRAEILRANGISFNQIKLNFKEEVERVGTPSKYVLDVVKSKQKEFFDIYPDMQNVLFADSIVSIEDKIFGKAKYEKDALDMLLAQSGNIVSVFSAMLFCSQKFEMISVNETKFEFLKFEENDLNFYLQSNEWQGKAGAMMIEGFNKKYIKSYSGYLSNARGLCVEILKAFL